MAPRTRAPVALLLALLQLPLLPVAGAEPPAATGPDGEGAWTLGFDVTRPHAGTVQLALDVVREDADGVERGWRDLGAATFSAGTTRHEVGFLPAEGSGRYLVGLLVDGARAGEIAFEVEAGGASREVAFEVPDAPTYLNLTNDDVNADGKTKAPGDALVTRAVLSDANGVGDVDALAWRVERDGALLDTGTLAHTSAPDATSAPLEVRYDRTPLAAGAYVLRMQATKGTEVVAEAQRTFQIRDVAPTFVTGALPNVTPDERLRIRVPVVLADKNGAVGPGALELRVYRGSTRVEGAGFAATLGDPARMEDANGAARWRYDLTLDVPARAAPASHRVSLYANDTLLASLPFEVRALPTLRAVNASTEAGSLRLALDTTGEGIATARLDDGDGAATSVSAPLGSGALRLDPPRRGAPLRWTVELRAREDGPVVAERNGTWSAPFDGPALLLVPLHARARLPAVWSIEADGWDVSEARADVRFVRWDGASEPDLAATLRGDRIRVEAPPTLAAGRYEARLTLTWPNGSASGTSWAFDAGPWVELALGEPEVDGRRASLAVHNHGGVTVTRLVVEAQPHAHLTLRTGDGTILTPRLAGPRAVFSGLTLAPGEEADLQLELPDGPLPSGRRAVQVRVLAQVGGR